jgi:heterodisulfide reductase subunit A
MEVPVNKTALIIGGGPAGMTAALTLADQGFPTHIIERGDRLGGNLNKLHYFTNLDDNQNQWNPHKFLRNTIEKIQHHPLITIHLNTELSETTGFKGNFTSILNNGHKTQVQHGIIIVATGGEEYKGQEYNYGKSDKILTQLEFEQYL